MFGGRWGRSEWCRSASRGEATRVGTVSSKEETVYTRGDGEKREDSDECVYAKQMRGGYREEVVNKVTR